jgi:hypothetical protein
MSAFGEQTQNQEAQQEQQEQNPSLLGELVGDDKKFKSVDDLAKGKIEADQFIDQLKSELSGLREELDKRMTSEEVLTKIREEANSANATQGDQTNPSLSEEQVAELVKKSLESTRTEEQRQSNLKQVDNKLVEIYGDKASAELERKANELGVGVDFLASVAMQSPAAFFNTVGINANQQTSAGVTTGSLNTESIGQVTGGNGPKAGSKAYYDQMRKENPRTYWSSKVQNQIFESQKAGTYQ